MQFIRKLGYAIEIPEQLKVGAEVGEYVLENAQAEIDEIKKIVKKSTFSSLGILAKEDEYLSDFRQAFLVNQKIHVMTMNEAQGVEFDVVILVGIGQDASVDYAYMKDVELAEGKKRIEKDLLYVALTRAIFELHVMGKEKLEDVVCIC